MKLADYKLSKKMKPIMTNYFKIWLAKILVDLTVAVANLLWKELSALKFNSFAIPSRSILFYRIFSHSTKEWVRLIKMPHCPSEHQSTTATPFNWFLKRTILFEMLLSGLLLFLWSNKILLNYRPGIVLINSALPILQTIVTIMTQKFD